MISILTAGKTALSRLKTTIDLADQLKKLLRVLLHSRTLTKGHPGFLPLNFLVECGAQFGKNRFLWAGLVAARASEHSSSMRFFGCVVMPT
jgi:hypothetical protein